MYKNHFILNKNFKLENGESVYIVVKWNDDVDKYAYTQIEKSKTGNCDYYYEAHFQTKYYKSKFLPLIIENIIEELSN